MTQFAAYPDVLKQTYGSQTRWVITDDVPTILEHADAVFLNATDKKEALDELRIHLENTVNASLPDGMTIIGDTARNYYSGNRHEDCIFMLDQPMAKDIQGAFDNATNDGVAFKGIHPDADLIPDHLHAFYKGGDVTAIHGRGKSWWYGYSVARILPLADDRAVALNPTRIVMMNHADWLRKCQYIWRVRNRKSKAVPQVDVTGLSQQLSKLVRDEFRRASGGITWEPGFTRYDREKKLTIRMRYHDRIAGYVAIAREFGFKQEWWDRIPDATETAIAAILAIAAKRHKTNDRFNAAMKYLVARLRRGKWRNELSSKKHPSAENTVPTSKT